MKIATLGVFATIFTWGFIQALKENLITPVIRSYLIPAKDERDMTIKLKGDQVLDIGEFVAELIQWIVLMAIIYIIWNLSRKSS